MSKKIDRALHGPTWTEVILGAALSVLLGAFVGALLLIARPVVVAKEMPKEPDPKAVYFIEGARDASKARQLLAKRKAFVEGQSIVLTEQELNAIAAPSAPAAKTPPAKKEGEKQDAASAGGMLTPGSPNFRIADEQLQVGVPVTIDVLGMGGNVIVQARGGFAKRGDRFVYNPETVLVGSCPVGRLPFVHSYLRDKFMSIDALPEDIRTSWLKLADVSIEGKTLKLTMP